jgi:uncharacterized protein YbcI
MSDPSGPHDGEVTAHISREMVRLLREYVGRGPTRARTTIGRDHVLILLGETLTKAEQTLAYNGHADNVLELRSLFQRVMRPTATEMVERATGRKVVAFMSDNHLDPDLSAEIFVLEPTKDPTDLAEVDAHEAERSASEPPA